MARVHEPLVLNRPEEEVTKVVQLDPKQRRFCEEYIIDFNATRAAIAAGYNKKWATPYAWRLRKENPHINTYIAYLQANLGEVTGITKMKVLQEHGKLAFSSIAHLHNTWIERKEFDALTDEQKSCIAEIVTQTRIEKEAIGKNKYKEYEVEYVKVKLYDKQRALDSIARMLGYDAASKLDVTGIPAGNVLNMQVNVYNSGPPLLNSDEKIK